MTRSPGRTSGRRAASGPAVREGCACGGGCPRCVSPAVGQRLQARPAISDGKAPVRLMRRQAVDPAKIDTIMETHPLTAPYAKAQHALGVTEAGHTTVLSEVPFKDRFVRYAMRSDVPGAEPRYNTKAHKPWSFDEARAFAEDVNGFVDGNETFIKEEQLSIGTALHEAIHKAANISDFHKEMGFYTNEGTTEYFTRTVCDDLGLDCGDRAYHAEYKAVRLLLKLTNVDPAVLADSFFSGGAALLRGAAGVRVVGAWNRKMRKGETIEAVTALRAAIREHGLPGKPPK